MKAIRTVPALLVLAALLSSALGLSPAAAQHSAAAAAKWTHLPGPTLPGGTVLDLEISQGTLYALLDAAVERPLYRSTDAGASWTRVGEITPTDSTVAGKGYIAERIVVALDNPQVLFAGAQDQWLQQIGQDPTLVPGQLLRSTDGGLSWTGVYTHSRVLAVASSKQVYAAGLVAPGQPGSECWASSFARSLDGGTTWQETALPCGVYPSALWVDPIEAQHLLLSVSTSGAARLLESRDGGQTWEAIYDSGSGYATSYTQLVAVPNQPGQLVAANQSLWASDDGGRTWRETLNRDQNFHLAVSGETVFAAGQWYLNGPTALFRSTDGGRTWWQSPHEMPNYAYDLLADPVQPGRLYAGLDELGVYASDDAGYQWQERNLGLESLVALEAVAVSARQPGLIYAGAAGLRPGLFRSLDGGQTWERMLVDTPSNRRTFTTIAIHPTRPEVVLAGGPEGALRSDDGGNNWYGLPSRQVNAIAFSAPEANGARRVYLSGWDPYADSAYVAVQKPGEASPAYTHLLGTREITALAAHPTEAGIVYAAGYFPLQNGPAVLRSSDGGKTFAPVALPEDELVGGVRDLVTDATDPQAVYAATIHAFGLGSIFASHDGGLTWQPQGGVGISPNGDLKLAAGYTGLVYLTGSGFGDGNSSDAIGVFRWDATAQGWLEDGLPGNPGRALALCGGSNPALYAAGPYGLWVQELPARRQAWLPVVGK